ncbi:MAG: hypothetical protein AAB588_01690 [Patescibacteria group bacterium]
MEKRSMIPKNKKILVGLIILLVVVGGIIIRSNKPSIDQSIIKESAFIPYPPQYNYRQTKNDCGPFNVAAVVRALKKQDFDSRSFVKKIGWRLLNNYTLPWGLENQLEENGIKIEKPRFDLLTDGEKIVLVRQHLSLGKPIIMLGEQDNYQHYLTLLGFNAAADEYYVYNSLQTVLSEDRNMTTDKNGSFPGNTTLNSDELLAFWSRGGMYGLWKWYGLVGSL